MTEEKIRQNRIDSIRMITSSFFKLLDIKAIDRISISEISDNAKVSRRTFYRIFKSKEEIIKKYIESLSNEYKKSCMEINSYDIETIAFEFFSFWYKHKDFLMLIKKRKLEGILYTGLREASVDIISTRAKTIDNIKPFIAFSSGGFINLLFAWIEEDFPQGPKEYSEYVLSSIKGMIRTTAI